MLHNFTPLNDQETGIEPICFIASYPSQYKNILKVAPTVTTYGNKIWSVFAYLYPPPHPLARKSKARASCPLSRAYVLHKGIEKMEGAIEARCLRSYSSCRELQTNY